VIDAAVLVVGGGAIGGVTAAKLTGAVRRVVVLDANREHVERLRAEGLLLDDVGAERRVVLDACADPEELDERFDFALVTLKAAFHHDALPPLREHDAADSFVSLGNGLVQDRIADLVGKDRLIAGIVEWGATNLGPGHLAKTTNGPFVVGELDGLPRDRTHRLAEVLQPAGEVRVTDDIRGMIWTKLLVNSVFSGLGAVAGLLYEEIVADPDGREVALAMWREGYDVGIAQGLALDRVLGVPAEALVVRAPEDRARAEPALERAMERHGKTKASMLQDLERGVPTEVDVIDGAVVDRGRAHGVPTPLHAAVVDLIHAAERGERRPERDGLRQLARRLGNEA
jgi:2-dehydropantoate 2-reductase